MYNIIDVIKNKMDNNGDSNTINKGTIILATLKSDIHDIGKNIVKILLDNYGFHIIDLGKDVPLEKVLEAVRTSKEFFCVN